MTDIVYYASLALALLSAASMCLALGALALAARAKHVERRAMVRQLTRID